MGTTAPRPRRWRDHLTTSDRSPDPDDLALLEAVLEAEQPRFWEAVVADATSAARFRGERHELQGRAECLAQVVRLSWVTEAFLALVCYRAEVACRRRRLPIVPHVLHRLSMVTGQVSIGSKAVVRPGLYLPHGQVVIDGMTSVGRDVVIRPFVTVGLRDGHIIGPSIGDRTRIGTGAKVFGPIAVGADARIGANAVVLGDVEAGGSAVGVPARVRTSGRVSSTPR